MPVGDRNTSSGDSNEEIVVSLSEDVENAEEAAKRALPDGATLLRANETLNHVLATLPESDVSSPNDIEKENDVKYVTNNPSVDPAEQANLRDREAVTEAPNDPIYGYQTAPEVTNALETWEITEGSSDVTLAIVDSGIKYDHEDLAANMDDSVQYHGANIVDGGSFGDTSGDPYPQSFEEPIESHGTQTAGIAGAATNNGVGVAGMSDCSILSVRVADPTTGTGWANGYDVVDGTEWAASQGADVILTNVDGVGEPEWSPFDDAVSYAESQGALVIAAAGNEGSEFDEYAFGSQAHIAVSATDGYGDLASFSSYGSYVDIAAPGRGGYTTYPANDGNPADEYDSFGGTSMAAPTVTAVAGLVLSVDPTLSVQELKDVLLNTASDLGIQETKQGAGRVNAYAAVQEVLRELSVGATGDSITPSGTAQINVSATGIEQIKVQDIWTDWEVSATQKDGATFTDHSSDQGNCLFSWDPIRASASISVSIDIPSRYIGGTYELPIQATANNKTEKTTVTININ